MIDDEEDEVYSIQFVIIEVEKNYNISIPEVCIMIFNLK